MGLLVAASSTTVFAENKLVMKMTDGTGFSVDTYMIPSEDKESPEQSLYVLANVLPYDVCYQGDANEVKKILDTVASSATNVNSFSSFAAKNTLVVHLVVHSLNKRKIYDFSQNQLIIEKCGF